MQIIGFRLCELRENYENSMLWRVMADIVVAVHAAYVAIVVIGFAAIPIGSAAQWRWVRNFYFRAPHLAMILLGACPRNSHLTLDEEGQE